MRVTQSLITSHNKRFYCSVWANAQVLTGGICMVISSMERPHLCRQIVVSSLVASGRHDNIKWSDLRAILGNDPISGEPVNIACKTAAE
jgi:hypothetical protein